MRIAQRLPLCALFLLAAFFGLDSARVSPGSLAAQVATSPGAPKRLATRWARDVRADNVLPEHPRPQFERSAWWSLNGTWDYAITSREASSAPTSFEGHILVPFAVESMLSGVTRAVTPGQYLWYQRTFERPPLLDGHRLLLHFGAVDWEASVWVNGWAVGDHRGGYDPFTIDITDALRPGAGQEVLVRVWDPTDTGPQPRGKQVLQPKGIWYTAVTGIWQPVWLETVPQTHLTGLRIEPDVDASVVRVLLSVAGAGGTAVLARVTLRTGETVVGQSEGHTDTPITVRVANPRLWSPRDPFLYDLDVRVPGGDHVRSYVGLRKIAVQRDAAGVNRLFLNGEPLFQVGLLDQGWWPDGLYTAPTDEALRFDIETTRKWGFNLIRKHVKVEPERWYYHCDRLGVLVWQDMPSGNNDTPDGRANFEHELARLVEARRNHPSIAMWVPFNEGWGQHDTERHVAWLTREDPTRPVNNASGWTDQGAGHVLDIHAYPGPAVPPRDERRAAVLGEFGGLGLPLEGHTWLDRGNWGYRSFTTQDALVQAYRGLFYQLRFMIGQGLAAAVYTQTTDVEIEVNGLMTYDREVIKLPFDVAQAIHAIVHERPPRVRTIVPSAEAAPQEWQFTTTAPGGGWYRPEFDASNWARGASGFGKTESRLVRVATAWTAPDIWLRRTVDLPAGTLSNPHLRIFHDDDAEVYVNGELVATLTGASGAYFMVPLGERARTLRPGTNTIAVHARQERGAQYIDVGLADVLR